MSHSAKDLLQKAKKIHDQEIADKKAKSHQRSIENKAKLELKKQNKVFISEIGLKCIENALKGVPACLINDVEIKKFSSQLNDAKLYVRRNIEKCELESDFPDLYLEIDESSDEIEEIHDELNELNEEKNSLNKTTPLNQVLKKINDKLYSLFTKACSDDWHTPLKEEQMIEEILTIPLAESENYLDNNDLFNKSQELLFVLKKYKAQGIHDADSEFDSNATVYLSMMLSHIQPLENALKNHLVEVNKTTADIRNKVGLIDKKIKELCDKKSKLEQIRSYFNIIDWSYNDDQSDQFPHLSPRFLNWISDNQFINELFKFIETSIINKKKFCEIIFKEIDDDDDGTSFYFDNFLISETIESIADMLNSLGYQTSLSTSSPTKNDAKNTTNRHILKISW